MSRAAKVIVVALVAVGIGIGAVVASGTRDPDTQVVTLPSGRAVEVIHMGFGEGSPQTWQFHYRTRQPLEKSGAVSCEVDALWKELQRKAEEAGAAEAIVEAQTFSRRFGFDGWRPVMLSHRSAGFLFRKSENGSWKNVGGSSCEA